MIWARVHIYYNVEEHYVPVHLGFKANTFIEAASRLEAFSCGYTLGSNYVIYTGQLSRVRTLEATAFILPDELSKLQNYLKRFICPEQ